MAKDLFTGEISQTATNRPPRDLFELRRPLGETATIEPEARNIFEELSKQAMERTQEAKEFTKRIVQPAAKKFISEAALGIPEMFAKSTGGEFVPEPKTVAEKLTQAGAGVAGMFLGAPTKIAVGIGKKVLPVAAKEGIKRIIGRSAIEGAVLGAETKLGEPKQIPKAAITGAVVGGGIPAALGATGAFIKGAGKLGARSAGVPSETLAEVEKLGFRNVLQKKYYNKQLPVEIQDRIGGNIENLIKSASEKYDKITQPLKKTPVSFDPFRQRISKLIKLVKRNPFKSESKDLNVAIINGIDKTRPKNLGDLLNLRRDLDEVIYSAKGSGVKSDFADKVRGTLNDYLHENKILKAADEEWYNLKNTMREIGDKITSDTGENFLKRFAKLTRNQKEKLVLLEKEIGGEPFIEDLTRFSFAQQFLTKDGGGGITKIPSMLSRPITRATLRLGETVSGIPKQFSKIK